VGKRGLITQEHIKEDLSLAYINAVAAKAGVIVTTYAPRDYKVDGSFRRVQIIGKKREPTGYAVEFQVKATVNWMEEESESPTGSDVIKYDLDAAAYNFLIRRKSAGGSPCIFILFCLPSAEKEWLQCSEDGLLLRKCCYWAYLDGRECNNASQKRISIPRFQQFNPETIVGLLLHAEAGTFNE
jgi:hypothetical protein